MKVLHILPGQEMIRFHSISNAMDTGLQMVAFPWDVGMAAMSCIKGNTHMSALTTYNSSGNTLCILSWHDATHSCLCVVPGFHGDPCMAICTIRACSQCIEYVCMYVWNVCICMCVCMCVHMYLCVYCVMCTEKWVVLVCAYICVCGEICVNSICWLSVWVFIQTCITHTNKEVCVVMYRLGGLSHRTTILCVRIIQPLKG